MKHKKFLLGAVAAVIFIVLLSLCGFARECLRGDADADGYVTTTDVRYILRAVTGKAALSYIGEQCADYDGDGSITTDDARLCMGATLSGDGAFSVQNSGTVRAVWVGTNSGDFPSLDNLSAEKLKAEIDSIVQTCADNGLNTIFFQVRAFSDAMYNSAIFPTSTALVENQGDVAPIDCLEYFVEAAHEKNIELHAWINPYRITSKTHSTSSLAASNPAVLHPEWVVKHFDENGNEAGLWFNPGLPEVRQLIVDGVSEIVNNYDVDGIHFDDYFYPYSNASGFEDEQTFAAYGNGKSLADFRRESVNLLVRDVYKAVKTRSSLLMFGISPFGVWAKQTPDMPNGTDGIGWTLQSYFDIYADSREWIMNHTVDYICPQVYWETDHTKAPFKPIVDWWESLCKQYNVALYIGVGVYKGDEAGSAYQNPQELINQIDYCLSKPAVNGIAYFAYHNIKNNTASASDTLKNKYSVYINDKIDVKEYPEIPSDLQAYAIIVSGTELMTMTGNPVGVDYGPTYHTAAILGMREHVVEKIIANDEYNDSIEYSRLSNGLYVATSDIAAVAGEVYRPTIVQSTEFSDSGNSTNLLLKCSQNVSCEVWLGDTEATVTLYNIYNPNDFELQSPVNGKLFTAVKKEVDGSTVKFILTYRSKYFIFGYKGEYNSQGLLLCFKNPVSLSSDTAKPLSGIKISLDPGHSTKGGAAERYNGVLYNEYDLNLELAKLVQSRLEALGATVRLSHNGEWKTPLTELLKEIRAWEPDINVSIHFNDVDDPTAHGHSTFWCFRNSALLAHTMANTYANDTGISLRSQSQPRAYYEVSRFYDFPSVLFETLFMSNPDDFGWYLNSDGRIKSADAITDGIVEFFRLQS